MQLSKKLNYSKVFQAFLIFFGALEIVIYIILASLETFSLKAGILCAILIMSSICGTFFLMLNLNFLNFNLIKKPSLIMMMGLICFFFRLASMFLITYLNLHPSDEFFMRE